MAEIDLQPITVRTGCQDKIGRLVLVDGELVAVLVRLDDKMHDDKAGKWFLEMTLRPLAAKRPIFENLDDASDWIIQRIA